MLVIKISRNQKKMILIGLYPHATELIFLTPVLANKTELFSYIVLHVMRLTYTRGMIRFSNCGKLSPLHIWVVSILSYDELNNNSSLIWLLRLPPIIIQSLIPYIEDLT